jgi:hypothetical protein
MNKIKTYARMPVCPFAGYIMNGITGLLANWQTIMLTVLILLIASGISMASQVLDPTDIGVGARPLGMGKAFTALSNDGSAIFTNPAGLAQNNSLKVISMAGNLMSEVPYTMVGASYPVLNGSIGIGYAGLGITGINETTLVSGTPEITGRQGNFTNSSLNLSYAQSIQNISMFKDPKVGATLKIISQGFSGGSFEGGGGTGFDLDLGAKAKITEDMDAGLLIKNIIPGNNFKSDEIPMVIQGGITKTFTNLNLLTALDAEYNRTILFHAGAEWNPIQLIKLRAGLDQKPDAGSTITNLAAGLGIIFKGFTFDYAYHTYAGLSDFSTHYFSFGYVGEGKKAEVQTTAPLTPAPAQIAPQTLQPKPTTPKPPVVKPPPKRKK